MTLSDLERQNAKSQIFPVDLRIYTGIHLTYRMTKFGTLTQVEEWRISTRSAMPHARAPGSPKIFRPHRKMRHTV